MASDQIRTQTFLADSTVNRCVQQRIPDYPQSDLKMISIELVPLLTATA
jgi:hypothetical protein